VGLTGGRSRDRGGRKDRRSLKRGGGNCCKGNDWMLEGKRGGGKETILTERVSILRLIVRRGRTGERGGKKLPGKVSKDSKKEGV